MLQILRGINRVEIICLNSLLQMETPTSVVAQVTIFLRNKF